MLNCFKNVRPFLNKKRAGEGVLVGPEGSETEIQALFDNAFYGINEGYVQQATLNPVLTCDSADVDHLPKGTRFVVGAVDGVGGVAYKLAGKRPDGTGITEVDLQKS